MTSAVIDQMVLKHRDSLVYSNIKIFFLLTICNDTLCYPIFPKGIDIYIAWQYYSLVKTTGQKIKDNLMIRDLVSVTKTKL